MTLYSLRQALLTKKQPTVLSDSDSDQSFTLPVGWKAGESGGQKVFRSPDNYARLHSLAAVERYVNAGPCPSCVDDKGRKEGHTGACVTFVLPLDWQKVPYGLAHFNYISPEGNKRFTSLVAVQRYLAGGTIKEWSNCSTKCSTCGRVFENSLGISNHMRSCTNKNAKSSTSSSHKESLSEEYERFIQTFRDTVEEFAIQSGFSNITMSPDVVALVGAEKQQTPHVDLADGQMQVILALTDGAQPTLVFHAGGRQAPTFEEACRLLEINKTSPSIFANVLQFAPAMALSKNDLLAGMKPVLDGSLSPSSTTWNSGHMLIADHTIVHAGPCQPIQNDGTPPRIVLFTTFTCHKESKFFGTKYNVADQYLPYHFCEDPTMPPERALQLLQEWKDDNPQMSYANNKQSKACALLLSKEAFKMSQDEIQKSLKCLRE